MEELDDQFEQKPTRAADYPPASADICERTLVSLLRGIGPWKHSIVLVGGLAPRYLVDQHPSGNEIPPHIGTLDIDLVIGVNSIEDVEAYATLEKNLKRLGFERGRNQAGNARHFQWRKRIDERQTVLIDLLQDAEDDLGGQSWTLPGERRLSALGIPGAQLALDDFIEIQVTAELLEDRGIATETIRVCGIVPFLVLKLRAYDDRFEIKDAYDIIYCVMHYPGGPHAIGRLFAEQVVAQQDAQQVCDAVEILRKRFGSTGGVPGSEKDGPVSYARFLAEPDDTAGELLLRQDAEAVAELFLSTYDASLGM